MAHMQMSFNLSPRLEMRLKMAPQIIQSIEILQLPLLALQERIEQEQLENPTLEIEEENEDEEQVRELTKAEDAEVNYLIWSGSAGYAFAGYCHRVGTVDTFSTTTGALHAVSDNAW